MKKLLALTLVVALLVSIPLVGTMGASKTKLSVWTFWKQSWVQPALDKFMAAHHALVKGLPNGYRHN